MSSNLRHYEIVFLTHPDQSEQVPALLERYETIIKKDEGKIHRLEDWGRRQLAYPINDLHKAHYILMNIECSKEALAELNNLMKFNDSILRTLVLAKKTAITGQSALMRKEKEEKAS